MTQLKAYPLNGAAAGTLATNGNTGAAVTDTASLLSYIGRGVYGSGLGLRAATSTTTGAFIQDATAGEWSAFYFFLPGIPTGDMTIATSLSGASTAGAIGILANQSIRLYSSLGTTVATSSVGLISTGSWYRAEWQVNASGQELRVFVDDGSTPIATLTGAVGVAGAVSTRRFGHPQGAKALGNIDFDQVTIHNAWPDLGNTAPVAAFTHSEVGLIMDVDATTSTDFPDGIQSYDWNWGDATTHGSGVTASHTYAAAGTYTVTLTVVDSWSLNNAVSQSVTVTATGTPVIQKTHPFNGNAGTVVTATPETFTSMTGTGLVYATPGVSGLTCGRVAGGLGIGNFGEDNGTTATFAGFFFRILATATGNTTLAVSLNAATQLAGMGVALSGGVTKVVLTSAVGVVEATSTTTIAANTWYRGEWQVISTGQVLRLYVGGSGTITETISAAVASALTPDKWRFGHPVGTRSADTTDIDQVKLTTGGFPGMVNVAPTASFTKSTAALVVNVDGSASTDTTDGAVVSYDWDWGDATAHGTGVTASHTYGSAGTRTLTLTVTDSLGATNATSQSVTTGPNVSPTAAFTIAQSGLIATVNGTSSSDSDGSIASYDWNWGDGTAHASGGSATHVYAAPGTFTITLIVTDNLGATGSITHVASPFDAGLNLRATPADNPAHVRGVLVAGVVEPAKVREVVGAATGGGPPDTTTYDGTYGGTY